VYIKLFLIGCAARSIVPPIVTILIIHFPFDNDDDGGNDDDDDVEWGRNITREKREKRAKEKKRSIDSYLN
jgi:hypothetical protein